MSVLFERRYLSVWLRRLSTDRVTRRKSMLAEPARADAFVVADAIKGAQRITALTDGAVRLGLKIGMGVADARAMYPKLPVEPADAEADARLLEAIADWCDRYTPLVGLDSPDGLLLDITGCAHLFGGEEMMCRDVVRRLALQGLRARVAVADTAGCAWGVARYGERINVPRGEVEAAALPLPIAALRIDPDIVAELASLGLKRIADLATRPRAPLAARFGDTLLLRLDQALGRVDEPISPRLPLPTAMAEQRFAEPIARETDVLGTIEQLARQLSGVLERRGEGARLIGLALFRADGQVHRLELGTGTPLRDPPRVRKLFEERLAVLGDACNPGFGFDVVRLSALVTERCDPAQTGLAREDHAAELAHLIDRFGARFGLRRVTRLVPQDTHIPEFAVAAMPAHGPQAQLPPTLPHRSALLPGGRGTGDSLLDQHDDAQDSLAPTRPLRLFACPEPIEAIAEVPDGPPVRFRWRQMMHQVAHVEGPERIATEWWRDNRGNKLTRDYFRVEDSTGARMWLYREGLFAREVKNPRWYLQGLFA